MCEQEALEKRDVQGARSAAKAAKAAFAESEWDEGVGLAAGLEQQADAMERVHQAALEGSEAVQAARAALSSGRLDEARRQAKRARDILSRSELGEAGGKGLETLSGLEEELAGAEMRAGLVREGLQASGLSD